MNNLRPFIFLLMLYIMLPLRLYAQCPKPKQLGNENYYSQIVEDYILSIIFDHIDKGTYVDAGANDPNHISVTKYFYLKGWRGINIEPVPCKYEELLKYRPEDININVAVGDKETIMNLDILDYDALSTFSKNLVETWKETFKIKNTIPVKVITLNSILQEHPMQQIHFLKIDVEGFEREVLLGIDLKKYRPWVIVIEAVAPHTLKPLDYLWRELIEHNDYQYIASDPYNAYFVAKEHYKELYDKFLKSFQCIQEFNTKLEDPISVKFLMNTIVK